MNPTTVKLWLTIIAAALAAAGASTAKEALPLVLAALGAGIAAAVHIRRPGDEKAGP